MPGPVLDLRLSAAAVLGRIADKRRWLTHPQEFAFEVIGPDALAAAARRRVESFAPEQEAFLAAYCDVMKPALLLSAGRGGTKTFLAALGVATMSYCLPRFTATVLAGSWDQGRILYDYYEQFSTSPRFRECIDGDPIKTLTRLKGGGWVRVLSASEKQVKGPHPDLLAIDEACAADSEMLILAMGQRAGSRLGLVRVASTPDKLTHVFRDWWEKADEQGWATFNWGLRTFEPDGTWRPTFPWMNRGTIEDLILKNDSNWVRIHIDGQFGSSTGTVFRYEDVIASKFDGDPVKHPLWNEDAVTGYRTGVDWGFQHPTVFTVVARLQPNPDSLRAAGLDEDRFREFYVVVHVEGWSQKSADFLYARLDDILGTWSGDVYMDASHPFENQAVSRIAAERRRTGHAIPFVRDKMGMVSHATMVLERGRLVIPARFSTTLEQMAAYSWEESRETPQKLNDDYVDSLMLALWGHRLGAGGPPGIARVDLGRPPG